ncbi:hypothetical protein [Phormidesmis priestleyi]
MTDDKSKPYLFISHKHVDSKIADVISRFVRMNTGGRVKIFQSSSPGSEHPKPGDNLNKSLKQALWSTNVLILIYTNPNQSWHYCMWECGLASHPASPDTKIIVFQCTSAALSVFSEQVNVNVKSLADVQKFTNTFLTDPDFFPSSQGAITEHQPNGQEVAEAAVDLYEQLQKVLPVEHEEPSEGWPAWPFLRLQISQESANRICDASPEQGLQITNELIQSECVVVEGDKVAGYLFGTNLTNGMKFGRILSRWKEEYPNSKSKWIEALSRQIMAGTQDEFPPSEWELMQGIDNQNWYAPMLNRVRKLPSQQCIQFDIYFHKFDVQGDSVDINVPNH